MAFTFATQRKFQKYLVVAFAGAVVMGIGLFWYTYVWQAPQKILVVGPAKTLEINVSLLEHPIFDRLGQALLPIPFPENVGRINPFLPLDTGGEGVPF